MSRVCRTYSSNICPDNLCAYFDHVPSWTEPAEGEDIHTLLHTPCDDCSSHPEQETLCNFCSHIRLRHLAICLQGKIWAIDVNDRNYISRVRSTKGCKLCSLMARAIDAQCDIVGQHSGYVQEKDGGFRLELNQNRILMQLRTPKLDVFTYVFYAQRPAPFKPISCPINWTPVRERISQCLSRISRTSRPPEMPRGFRLINVKTRSLESDFSQGSKLGTDIKFVTLSYVWGSSNPSKHNALLSCNQDELSKPDGLGQNVPRVVKDAIIVCQQLGQSYLWVDRYCILQDGFTEKEAQINVMSDIYSSAEFTIIHATGTSLNDPIPGVTTTRDNLQTRATMYGLDLVSGYPGIKEAMVQSIWNTRGWTYQESVLCPRRLLFTSHEIFFECDDKDRPKWREHFDESTILVGSTGMLGHKIGKRNFDNFYRHLEHYTARSLTYKSDIIKAFTGVLTMLYDGAQSIDGLPEVDFDRAILWYTRGKLPASFGISINFPSWSWASAGSIIKIPVESWPVNLMTPLVHWTHKPKEYTGEPKVIKSNKSYRNTRHSRPISCLLAAWWKGCVEAPFPDSVKNLSAPVCGEDDQSSWIERLCGHLERCETCEQCESYLKGQWSSLDDLWANVHQSAGRKKIDDHSCGSCMVDRPLARDLNSHVLFTRAQTAHFRVGKQRDEFGRWCFVDAKGSDVGEVFSDRSQETITWLQASLREGLAECMAISLSHDLQPLVAPSGSNELVLGVNVLIIARQKKAMSARRIGAGYIYLWEWAKADRRFEDISLE